MEGSRSFAVGVEIDAGMLASYQLLLGSVGPLPLKGVLVGLGEILLPRPSPCQLQELQQNQGMCRLESKSLCVHPCLAWPARCRPGWLLCRAQRVALGHFDFVLPCASPKSAQQKIHIQSHISHGMRKTNQFCSPIVVSKCKVS